MALTDRIAGFFGDEPIVLELDLARGVLSARPSNPFEALKLLNSPSLSGLRAQLAAAADDDRVKGLIVHAAPQSLAWAHGEEIAELIETFGRSKATAAWAESFGELSSGLLGYYIASAAQQVWVQPTGMLSIPGLHLEVTLLKGMLNKAGIEPQFGQRHEYKTAADRFAADNITEAHSEMMEKIGQSLLDSALADIVRRRNLEISVVKSAIDEGLIEPERAVELGLIDKIGYRDQVYSALLEQWQAQPQQLLFAHRYAAKGELMRKVARKKDKIAIITLRGAIVTGRGVRSAMSGEQAGADVIDEKLRHALKDDSVKAVIFDVDSPGGSAVASDFIRRGVVRLREAGKPVVAQMGTVAASGGYYVSMAANEIVASPSTLTGSIGVLAGKMVTAGLYDKLGLVRQAWDFGTNAGMLASTQKFSEHEWEQLNIWLDRVYRDFTTLAAQDRGMAYDELEALARGRVWTGADAKERGLVDHLGGRRTAVERVCALAGLDEKAVDFLTLDESGLLSKLRPASSSEAISGTHLVPVGESLLQAALTNIGLSSYGVLSLPWKIAIK